MPKTIFYSLKIASKSHFEGHCTFYYCSRFLDNDKGVQFDLLELFLQLDLTKFSSFGQN